MTREKLHTSNVEIRIEDAKMRYERVYPNEIRLLQIAGVYPEKHKKQRVNPYTGEIDNEDYSNIGEHNIAVARGIALLRKYFPQLAEQFDIAELHGLLHDANKAFEIQRRKAHKSGKIEDAYTPQAYETISTILRDSGHQEVDIKYLERAGKETGHNSLAGFIVLGENGPRLNTSIPISDMLVHLVDDMTFTSIPENGMKPKTLYLTPKERMSQSDFPTRYPFLYKEGIGFNAQGAVVVKDVFADNNNLLQYVKTYAEWQVWVSEKICEYLFRQQWGFDAESGTASQYYKDLINVSLHSEQQ